MPPLAEIDPTKLIEHLPAIVSVASAAGILLLLPLYRSQHRDVARLRAWRERDPEYPVRDLAASEAVLDSTEAELEELGIGTEETEAVPATETGPPPATPVPAATRVTSERPALSRITMERAALAPHPRWRRFVARATQPWVLVAIGAVALLVGIGGIFASERLLSGGEEASKPAKIDKASVRVAVLNGTAITGLGQKVGGVVQENGYDLGNIGGTTPDFAKTQVLYAPHQKKAAQKVAQDLGIDPEKVEQLDREHRREVDPDTDVVVIAGEDKAKQ